MPGHMIEIEPGVWRLCVEGSRSADGKRRRRYFTFHGGVRAAKQWKNAKLAELEQAGGIEPSRATVAEYLRQWLELAPRKAPKSRDLYGIIVEKHLIPKLGHRDLQKLTTLQVQQYVAEALKSGRRDGKGGLSPVTVSLHFVILKAALSQAVRWQLLSRNPCDGVTPPEGKSPKRAIPDQELTLRLLKAVESTRYFEPVLLAIATGLRRGEVLGLHWKNTYLPDPPALGRVTICQSLIDRTNGKYELTEPKTDDSAATITLPPTLVRLLVVHKARQARARIDLGELWEDRGLVFPAEDGRLWNPNAFYRGYLDLLDAHGLPRIRFHDLRHLSASVLIDRGVHAKAISERLRHRDIGETMNRYGHLMPGADGRAALEMEAALQDLLPPGDDVAHG